MEEDKIKYDALNTPFKDLENCPNNECRNQGFTAEHDCGGNEKLCITHCPIQVQCEFCYTNANSVFNN